MKAYGTTREDTDEAVLTEKQRRVLDLLIENKTSKEIGRALGISPYTVDQRISLARGKLGVSSRNELAARYRVMRKVPARSLADIFASGEGERSEAKHEGEAGESLGVAQGKDPMPGPAGQDDDVAVSAVSRAEGTACPTAGKIDYRVGPEVFEGRAGGLWRMGAIVAAALLLVMTILGSFAIFDQLNDVLT